MVVERAVFFDATHLPSYEEVKTLPVTPLSSEAFALLSGDFPLPSDGTVKLTSLETTHARVGIIQH